MGKPGRRASASSVTDWTRHLPNADKNLCVLCKHAVSDDADPTVSRLGRSCRFEHDGRAFLAHRNCLYAAPGLGKNDVLMPHVAFGFSPENILKEARRGRRLSCYFCKLKGAVHGCSIKNCRRSFHLYCGLKCNLLCLFTTTHSVYCESHASNFLPGTDFVSEVDMKENDTDAVNNVPKDCCICKMPVFDNDAFGDADATLVGDPRVQLTHKHVKNSVETTKNWLAMRLTCCQRNNNEVVDFVHRWCLERLSERKGLHNLRCPNCHDHVSFVAYLKKNGIFLEDKINDDAEPIDRYAKCTADMCKVDKFDDDEEKNRTYKEEAGLYDIGACSECGRSLHTLCAYCSDSGENEVVDDDDFYCQMCYEWKKEQPASAPTSFSSVEACNIPNLDENTQHPKITKAAVSRQQARKSSNRRLRTPGSPIVDAVAKSSNAEHDGFEPVVNEAQHSSKSTIVYKRSDADRSARAVSDASSVGSLSSFSSASTVRSALSVISTTSSAADADSSQPQKRAKLNDDAEPSAGTSSSFFGGSSRMRVADRHEALAATATAGLGEERRHIRFTIKRDHISFPATPANSQPAANSSACPTCHRVEAVRTFCTVGTQTDANVSVSTASQTVEQSPTAAVVIDAVDDDIVKSPNGVGGIPSSSSATPLKHTIAQEEQPTAVKGDDVPVGSVPVRQDVNVSDDDEGDITFEREVYHIDD